MTTKLSYKTCPKCGHQLDDGTLLQERCPACGVVFRKWLRQSLWRRSRGAGATHAALLERRASPDTGAVAARWRQLRARLLTPADDGRAAWGGRLLVGILLLWLSLLLPFNGYEAAVQGQQAGALQFLHRIDLVFHEAGHVVFRLFGEFMTILGGSLLQILVPLLFTGAFVLRYANHFGAAVTLWWTGQNVIDVGIYMADARQLRLPLLGGGTGADRPGFHDWHNLLGRMGLLEHTDSLAMLTTLLGWTLVLTALVWAAALLWRQHCRLAPG